MGTWVIKTGADYQAARAEIQKNLDEILGAVETASASCIHSILDEIKAESVNRAPIKDGDLRKQAFVEVEENPGLIEGKVGFHPLYVNGYDYVIIQHEHLEFNHPGGGQAKFFESVIVERKEAFKQRMIGAIKGGDTS